MPEMKKLVLKLDLNDIKEKQKAMKAVSSLSGVDSLSMDMKDKKLTVVGDIDPVVVVSKLRKKNWHTEIVTVGPAKESEKKKEDDKKKEGDKNKDGEKKKTDAEIYADLLKQYNTYLAQHYVVHSAEENPNACVIC